MEDRIAGPNGHLYADPQPGPDERSFQVDNTSAAYDSSPYYLPHKNQVEKIPIARNTTPLALVDFLPSDIIAAIEAEGEIVFHATGDIGAAKVNRSQTAATALGHEAAVADAMAAEVDRAGSQSPAFFFHL